MTTAFPAMCLIAITAVDPPPRAFVAPPKPPPGGFGYSYDHHVYTRRGPGQALSALLGWMESAVRRWGESGLAAWLRFVWLLLLLFVKLVMSPPSAATGDLPAVCVSAFERRRPRRAGVFVSCENCGSQDLTRLPSRPR